METGDLAMKSWATIRFRSPGNERRTMGMLKNIFKRLTYQPALIRLARGLRLSKLLRKWYYWWARPDDGIVVIDVGGIQARFYVRGPEELRIVESAGGGEDEVLRQLVKRLRPGDVVYDVGANVGLYSVVTAKAVGKTGHVVAFEPARKFHEHLLANVALNGLTNVRCFRLALGDRVGQGTLRTSDVIGNLSLLSSGREDAPGEVVDIVAGDTLTTLAGLPPPRLVKIDVEGSEYAVIQGLRETLSHHVCQFICCEVHPMFLPAGVEPESVQTCLRSLGFNYIETRSRWDGTFHLVASKIQL
jgi:FkbM family methyltransferase